MVQVDVLNKFLMLPQRYFMTPSYLSSLIMYLILPAKFNFVVDKKTVYNLPRLWDDLDHAVTALDVNGQATLALTSKKTSQLYEIYCCGNAQNGMNMVYSWPDANKNHVFWNYPGVGHSGAGAFGGTDDLVQAAYQQVKRLLQQGVPAKNIRLFGLSLGGGVAVHAARLLYEEGHFVNLTVDRSFASLAPVIPETIKSKLSGNPYYPLIACVAALALSGLAVGTTCAGLVASLGLTVATLLHYPFPEAAAWVGDAINLMGSVAGGAVALAGFVAGLVLGVLVGAFISVQKLWTNDPMTLPMIPAFRAALLSACCELDSVAEMKRLLHVASSQDVSPNIQVINTLDDEVISVAASLNKGLGIDPVQGHQGEPLQPKFNSFWYRSGGHMGQVWDRISVAYFAR